MSATTLTRTRAQRRYFGALSGVLYVLFFVAGLVVASVLGPSGTVTPYSSDAEVQAYRLKDPATLENLLRTLGLLQGLSALALLAFVPSLTGFVRRYGSDARAGMVRALATVAGALLLLSASTSWVLAQVGSTAELSTYRAVSDLSFITGAAPAISTLGVAVFLIAATGRASHALPAWITWSGTVIGVASVLSMSSLTAAGGSVFIPIGRFLGFAWFVALSVLLWRHDGRTGDLPGARVPRHT
ncbi:hypothetical protein RKE30_38250 [Streptomyces sp. Li-HN-5-11]|uniref:hypothetical protein n=1 Tax=Streptomyces sp. Li-HN-5-11 TaxID=3075432 RepID=UPI0028AADCE8|nr:hypothetical protein [Streptomyces sp. Li-HN-5-11]WNM35787.1 hypothetical protein RKE30_38250 [Streptomyces sp. Li-HN-5-11]